MCITSFPPPLRIVFRKACFCFPYLRSKKLEGEFGHRPNPSADGGVHFSLAKEGTLVPFPWGLIGLCFCAVFRGGKMALTECDIVVLIAGWYDNLYKAGCLVINLGCVKERQENKGRKNDWKRGAAEEAAWEAGACSADVWFLYSAGGVKTVPYVVYISHPDNATLV